MADTPVLSVITVNYNDSHNLSRTIESVLGQTFPGFEYVVVDGGSTDSSVELIKSQVRINKWISEKDNGIYDAMNKGIALSTGRYIFFLNAGDLFFDKTVLQDIVNLLSANSFPDIVFGNVALSKGEGYNEGIQKRMGCDVTDVYYKPLNHQSLVASRAALTDKFDTNFRILADYNWFLSQLISPAIRILYVDRIISRYDMQGFSATNSSLLQAELNAVRELYFRKGYVWLLSRMKGTKLMYFIKIKFIRKFLNRTMLKTRIHRESVANV